jgi:hypothetical protein
LTQLVLLIIRCTSPLMRAPVIFEFNAKLSAIGVFNNWSSIG